MNMIVELAKHGAETLNYGLVISNKYKLSMKELCEMEYADIINLCVRWQAMNFDGMYVRPEWQDGTKTITFYTASRSPLVILKAA